MLFNWSLFCMQSCMSHPTNQFDLCCVAGCFNWLWNPTLTQNHTQIIVCLWTGPWSAHQVLFSYFHLTNLCHTVYLFLSTNFFYPLTKNLILFFHVPVGRFFPRKWYYTSHWKIYRESSSIKTKSIHSNRKFSRASKYFVAIRFSCSPCSSFKIFSHFLWWAPD